VAFIRGNTDGIIKTIALYMFLYYILVNLSSFLSLFQGCVSILIIKNVGETLRLVLVTF